MCFSQVILQRERSKLFSTAFHNCQIQRLQARGSNRHAVFLVTESEAITYHYELNLGAELPPDPRIAHTLNLRIDEYGNVLESVAVAYPRIGRYADTRLPEGAETQIAEVQQERHLIYTENRLTQDVIESDIYRLRLPCEVKTYELTGIAPAEGFYYTLAELRSTQIGTLILEIPYHVLPNNSIPQKRLVEWVRMLYFSADLQTFLPWGELNHLGLPYETYKLALTDELLTEILTPDRLNPEVREDLENAGVSGYLSGATLAARFPDLDTNGQYWMRSGIAGYDRYSTGTVEERRSARLAAIHANTPAVTHLDSLGREVVAIAHNKLERDGVVTEEKYLTYTKLDIEGKPLWIRDARGNRVMEYINRLGAETDYVPCYDIAGNLLFQHSMDGGDRWLLVDAAGKPFYAWDANDRAIEDGSLVLENRRFHTVYDALHRPREQYLSIDDLPSQLIEQFVYGDTPELFANRPPGEIPEAQERNLRGQVYQHYDASGLITNQRFDFKGNLLEVTRQLTQTYAASVINWAVETLSDEVLIFTQRTEYDALYRLIEARGRENYHATEATDQFEATPFPFPTADLALRNYRQFYTYDAVGNIEQMRHVADRGSWTRNYEYAEENNRLIRTTTNNPSKTVEYRYDTHGSMLNLNRTPDEYRLRWDYRDMVHSANLGGGGQVFYNYDAGKQRSRKRIERQGNTVEERLYLGGMELYRRWLGDNLVEEIETHHLFVDEQRVLMVEDVLVA